MDAPISVKPPVLVMEVPGERPMSPLTVVGPVFVMVEAPITAKDCAEPRMDAADARVAQDNVRANNTSA